MTSASPPRAPAARGIVLAAGRSERMGGTPKALLEIKNEAGITETFVARALRILEEGGVPLSTVVVNPSTRDAIRDACPPGTSLAVNERPEDGMVSSIRAALAAGGEADKVLVTLVDIPEVSSAVVRTLIDFTPAPGAWMAFPVFSDGRGHPLVLYRAVFSALRADLPEGLKTLASREPHRVHDVPVAGPQPWDVDTPEDYRRYRA